MSTAGSLEITLKSKIIYRLLFMSATPASVPDDTEVVPPKSQMRIHRPSIPFPLIDDEQKKAETLYSDLGLLFLNRSNN